MRIVALDDDVEQLALVAQIVQAMGHSCDKFERGHDLIDRLGRGEAYDLMIVDWQMPGLNGPDVVLWTRENVRDRIPILFLTNRKDERDIVHGLTCGADDFMLKPVRVGEFVARIRALLRRSRPDQARQDPVRVFGPYRFDTRAGSLNMNGEAIELKPKEFRLALCLLSNSGRLLSRNYLLQEVWGVTRDAASRTLDTHISKVRTRLKLRPENGYRLIAVYGGGYRLDALEDHDETLLKPEGPESDSPPSLVE